MHTLVLKNYLSQFAYKCINSQEGQNYGLIIGAVFDGLGQFMILVDKGEF